MPDIQKIKLDFQTLFGKSKKNPEMPEEELRTLFTKSDILENLGYGTIGKDIRLELFIKGKKSDIACIDDYCNIIFVVEFKKPSDSVDIKDHFDQLWDRYVKPLRADFGALINGYELILYRRIGENNNLELRVNLSEITDKDCELIYKLLKKPDYSLTMVKDILNYLNNFSAPESRVYLTTDAAREHFFENFNIETEIKGSERRGGTFLVVWGVLVMRLIRKMRRDLVESVFEEDLFYWWTDDFEGLQNNIYTDERSYEVALMDFSRALGEFYTPKEVVEYIIDAVDYRGRGIVDKRLLDPACGSGTFLVDALKRYLDEAKPLAEEKGWDFVISKLCNEYHIVGFDIHPFATIMAQIQFMLVLIPYYKKAIEKNKNFVLKRLPIFRTDSLIDESKSEAMTLSIFEGGRSISIKITLPVRAGNMFVDAEVIMPFRGEAISEKTGLLNIPEYFAALQALFDTVKEAARAEQQAIAQERLESNLKVYLQNKDWARLAGFFMPYGRYFLDTIKKLRTEYGDGRLVKSIEDIILAGLLKNHVEYDFVVGNPPYVKVQMLPYSQREYYKNSFETAKGQFDLYVLFIERGIKWIKENQNLGFITPNQFLYRDYGNKLRNFINDNCRIEQIIDFGDSGVFSDATNYPSIIILKKSKINQNSQFKVGKVFGYSDNILENIKKHILEQNYESDVYLLYGFQQKNLSKNDIWDLASPERKAILKKLTANSDFTLGKLTDQIYEGFISGANSVYFVDRETIEQRNLETKILKPIPKGKDVRRWRIKWEGNCVIYPYYLNNSKMFPFTEEQLKEKFPNIFEYLLDNKATLDKRYCVKEKNFAWFLMHDAADPRWFELPKLITPNLSTGNNFAFDSEGTFYLDHDCYGLLLNDKGRKYELFILALLNSTPLEFYLKHISPFASGKYYRYMTAYLEKLPIFIPKTAEEQALASQITARVEQILAKVKSDQRAARFPEEYIKEYRNRGEEFDAREMVFNANHKELAPEVERSLDNEFLIKIKGASPIVVDSESKAEYIKAALAGRKVSKGEKIEILIPRADTLAKEAVAARQKDLQEAQGNVALEDEINELVYKLYGLDENDRKVIEEFLSKF
jgi:type I restriction-modification system DNA methylase subunit